MTQAEPKMPKCGEPCPRCGVEIMEIRGEPFMEIWDSGFREYLAVAYELLPCGDVLRRSLR